MRPKFIRQDAQKNSKPIFQKKGLPFIRFFWTDRMQFSEPCQKHFAKGCKLLTRTPSMVSKCFFFQKRRVFPEKFLWTHGRFFWQAFREFFVGTAKFSISKSGKKFRKTWFFRKKILNKIFLWTRNFQFWEPCCQKFFSKKSGMIEKNVIRKMTWVQKVPLYRLNAVLRTLAEVFQQRAETFWLNFRERFFWNLLSRNNCCSSNVPLDT